MSLTPRMLGVNIRMTDDLIEELSDAAQAEGRTLRGLIRYALREKLAKRGLLNYYNVKTPLALAYGADDADAARP